MAVYPLYRPLLRRQLHFLRTQRQGQRRGQSSSSKPPDAPSKRPSAPLEERQIPIANNVPTLPFWQRLGPLTRLAEAYARGQRSRPYVTQLCSSLVIYFCADLSAQSMNGDEYDPVRTGRSLTIGAISSIPSYNW